MLTSVCCWMRCKGILLCIPAVSYTHLDVYKRQFLERVHYLGFNSDEAAEYHLLVEKIAELRKAKDIPDHLIFYLATPPQKYGPIAEALRKSKLNKASEEGGWRRIIVEKPFGSSLETAQALNKQLCSIFDEEDIYRIDHFLGKETVQNILDVYKRQGCDQTDFSSFQFT